MKLTTKVKVLFSLIFIAIFLISFVSTFLFLNYKSSIVEKPQESSTKESVQIKKIEGEIILDNEKIILYKIKSDTLKNIQDNLKKENPIYIGKINEIITIRDKIFKKMIKQIEIICNTKNYNNSEIINQSQKKFEFIYDFYWKHQRDILRNIEDEDELIVLNILINNSEKLFDLLSKRFDSCKNMYNLYIEWKKLDNLNYFFLI